MGDVTMRKVTLSEEDVGLVLADHFAEQLGIEPFVTHNVRRYEDGQWAIFFILEDHEHPSGSEG